MGRPARVAGGSGLQGTRRAASPVRVLDAAFDDYHLELERSVDVGEDEVVLLLQQRGQIKGSGDPVDGPIGYLAQIRDGLVTRVNIYFSWDATLDAAGLSE
jgi:ketosteroid isomerase-like protein